MHSRRYFDGPYGPFYTPTQFDDVEKKLNSSKVAQKSLFWTTLQNGAQKKREKIRNRIIVFIGNNNFFPSLNNTLALSILNYSKISTVVNQDYARTDEMYLIWSNNIAPRLKCR